MPTYPPMTSGYTGFLWTLLLSLIALFHGCHAAPYGPAVVYLQSVADSIPGLQALTPVPWSTTETLNCSVPWTGVTCVSNDTYVEVDISNRGLTGTFPVAKSDFADGIVRWNSSHNYISGLIPNPIALQSSNSPLLSLDVSYNNHTGFRSDPGSVSANNFIEYYDASENPTIIAAASAVFLWRYPNLRTVKCRNCNITGAWPTSSWQSVVPSRPLLEVVDFSYNSVTGTFWAASDDFGFPPLRDYRANNNLLSSGLMPISSTLLELVDFSSNPSFSSFGTPSVPAPLVSTLNVSRCGFTGAFPNLVATEHVAGLTTLDVSHNAITQVASPSGLVELYAQNSSLTTMTGSTLNTLEVYRIEFNSVTACQSFSTLAPMTSCNLTYNLADFGPCSVPAECQTMPQSIEIPPPQAPPVDPPLPPAPFDAATQSYLRAMAASIPGLQSLAAPWSTSQTMYCETPWTGITCTVSNTRLSIDISNLGLTGNLPVTAPFPLQSICDLKPWLVRFNISSNQIGGALPTINCGGFPHLTHFDVSFNLLAGPLNGGWWSATALVYYSIRYNPLKADGQFILYDLAGIDEVYADHCELTGDLTGTEPYSSEIPRDTIVIDLSHNNYTGLFDGVRVRDGGRIIASHNMISAVSVYLLETAGNASLIDLSYNLIDTVHAPFNTSAYNMTRLDLSHNRLAGHLSFASALAPGAATQQLNVLDVSFNSLTRLTAPPLIYELYAHNNSLDTLNGTTNAALRVYRVDSNNATACEPFTTTVSPMLDCDLRYNYIEDTSSPACDVPPECLVQPQSLPPPPPPVDPPVEPPADPPMEPPADPPVEPPADPPIDPPAEVPVSAPVQSPTSPPGLSTGVIITLAFAVPAGSFVIVGIIVSVITSAAGGGGASSAAGGIGAIAGSARAYDSAGTTHLRQTGSSSSNNNKHKTRKRGTTGRRGNARVEWDANEDVIL